MDEDGFWSIVFIVLILVTILGGPLLPAICLFIGAAIYNLVNDLRT